MTRVSWNDVKKLLDSAKFPEAEFKKINTGEVHGDRTKHLLGHYRFSNFMGGYPVDWEYTYCGECKKIWWKKATVFNNDDGLCYQHFFVKSGDNK